MRYRSVYFITLIVPFLAACSEGFHARSIGTSSLSLCAAALKAEPEFVAAKVFSSQKIQLNNPMTARAQYVATLDMGCMGASGHSLKSKKIHLHDRRPASIKNNEGVISAMVTVDDSVDINELEKLMQNENCIMGFSENVKMFKQAIPNDPRLAEQKNLTAMGFLDSYDFYEANLASSSTNMVVIATVDDGINLAHPDLMPSIWVNARERNGTAGVDDDSNGYIDDVNGYDFASSSGDPSHKGGVPHGSHVAGLAAAASDNGVGISGVATQNVKVMALNVFGEEAGTTAVLIDEAIRYAADNGANVINLSLGGQGRSPSTLAAIQYAISQGVTVVAAAGNDSAELTDRLFFSPASYAAEVRGMISVGASNASNGSQICNFSNYSATYVEITAPGCDTLNPTGILSTVEGSAYERYNGTSMAAPQVSGAAAIAFLSVKNRTQRNPTPAEVEDTLVNSAKVETALANRIKGGRHLHLNLMANLITANYLAVSPGLCR